MAGEIQNTSRIPITLSRTLGVGRVTLLGIGALLGGGIFTLIGHAAGLSGGGLVIAILLGALISFLNLNAYVSLATTFPQAGGGYTWVKTGLGNLQGFLSGWFSFMASAVACALYAVSFGIFAREFFTLIGPIPFVENADIWKIIFTVFIIVIFGFVHRRGVGFSGTAGGLVTISILSILVLYILFGVKHLFEIPFEQIRLNTNPLLPFGIAGVLQAAGLFYIAFEGSEIQAQSGEEAKNPSRTLKIGLFSSWAIISGLYLLISAIMIAATEGVGLPSWSLLGESGERAIIESANQFIPFGYPLMIIGGLLANIAALNATIYASSRVLFAMARDNFVWSKLSKINPATKTPYLALLASVITIIAAAIFLPLKDIASVADILFILLFMQLNIAYIQLRRKKPEAEWYYVVPFGVLLPISAIILYVALIVALFHVSPTAIYLTIIWLLLGLVNYLGYVRVAGEKKLEQEIKYEHATRFQQKSGYRIVVPVEENKTGIDDITKIAFEMARAENGEIFALHIHEISQFLPLDIPFDAEEKKEVLDRIESAAIQRKFNVYTRIVAARSVPETLLDVVQVEDGDLLIMEWDGYVSKKGFIFGKKIDTVLHRAHCDLIVAKLDGPIEHVRKILIPVPTEDNHNLRFTGRVINALTPTLNAEVTVAMVIPEETKLLEQLRLQGVLEKHLQELKLKNIRSIDTKIMRSDYIVSAIIQESDKYDAIVLPADRGRISKAIGMGTIPEQVAKRSNKIVLMTKGYRGIVQPFFDYIQSRF
ncbi:MAG: amino acid permease [Parcubacteria group bacterium]|nr:amino acid permease [Parcubacteria group bacterium]